jgi:CO dehydrogenase nickel-insertion accessory protein CooC1
VVLTFYGKAGCTPCVVARLVVARVAAAFGVPVVDVDVDATPGLPAAIVENVPVIDLGPFGRFQHFVTEPALARALAEALGVLAPDPAEARRRTEEGRVDV